MSGDERFLIPHNYSPEAEAAMIAITARLRPIAESTTTRLVEVTYWRDGSDMPVTKTVFDTHTVGRWRRNAPIEATHLTIEERAWPARAPWRFDVPEVPPSVTALKDGAGTVWLRLPDDTWTANEYVRTVGARFTHMADSARLPLVECPDPRAAS